MKVIVIGGAGYIGAHIVDSLCEEGHDVLVFDNLNSGFKENLNEKCKFINGDILDSSFLDKVFEQEEFDALIHMAALKSANKSMDNTQLYTTTNLMGSINVISAAIKFNIDKIIFSSTAAVYGNPMTDVIDEKHPINPVSYYGLSKLYVEQYLALMERVYGIKYIALRYFNAAGYSEKLNLIKYKEVNPQNLLPIIMEVANGSRSKLQIFGNDYNTKDGTCIRDYIHVIDLADAHIKALEYLNKGSSCSINLSSNRGYSVLEVVNYATEIIGREIKFKFSQRRPGDPTSLISSNNLARKKLKWTPRNSTIQKIITTMWEHYK
tara:strand:+ start:370 stop:1335 length:966 start_codon:yes stop_codon:yes gene_type:complete